MDHVEPGLLSDQATKGKACVVQGGLDDAKKFITDFNLESEKKKTVCTDEEIEMCQMSFMSKVMERTLRQIFSVLEFFNSFSSLAKTKSLILRLSQKRLSTELLNVRKKQALSSKYLFLPAS